MEERKAIVQLKNITKSFGDNQVLKPISLDIYEGEFLTLLGSSGCGKTTTLRIIAGFETPTEGNVYIEDKDVTELAPYNRDVNTVFQSYALFPHMTVFDNIAFGLVEKKMDKKKIKKKFWKCWIWYSSMDLRRESHRRCQVDRNRELQLPGHW